MCSGTDKGNGTPFNVTSIQEEDIIEHCVELGQTHPKGVLQFLMTESVVLFHSTDEMLVMVHGVTKAMPCVKNPLGFILLPLYYPCEGIYSSERWTGFRHPVSDPR